MAAKQKPNAISVIEQRLIDLPEECTRAKALRAVRAFRTSWISLGEHLTEIAHGGYFKDWGYESFGNYCRDELGLKTPTVRKIMVSYNYIRAHNPALIESASKGETTLPEYQTVFELYRANGRDDVDEDELREVEARVMSGEETDERAVRRRIAGLCEDPKLPGMQRAAELHAIRREARKLAKLVDENGKIPPLLRQQIVNIARELESIF